MDRFNRSSRIKNWSLGSCVFIPEKQGDEFLPDKIPLANLSESGLGLWIEDSRVFLAPGATLRGEIRSEDKSFKAEIKVVRQNHFVYGCNFIKPIEGLADYLHSHYAIEITANEMISVEERLLALRPEGRPHWFSDGFSELYYIENGGIVVYYRIHCQDREIERKLDQAARFCDLQERPRLIHGQYEDIDRFLNHINHLPFEIRNQITSDIEKIKEDL